MPCQRLFLFTVYLQLVAILNGFRILEGKRRQDMLILKSIAKDYQTGDTKVEALRGVSLQFRECAIL